MAIDSTKIPKHQWIFAVTKGIKMAVTQPNSEECLQFELFNTIYDINDAISKFDTVVYGFLEERLQTWSQRLINHQQTCSATFQYQAYRLRQHFLSERTQLQLLCSRRLHRRIVRDSISEMMVMNEALGVQTRGSKNARPISSWLMEAGVVPSCLIVAWFARYVMLSPPIRRTLLRYKVEGPVEYLSKVINYCEALVFSDRDESDALVRAFFGHDLKAPRRLNFHIITHHLVQRNASTEYGA
ncbi:MAG: hypothetical protein GOMPHAMPRED_008156 [Gomphillus americanus]|uniref:Uncharacterized protein n=1 Tax=Gomphillus americanus TaxID=1940652 RepID=A0A8H3EXL1_9LECA|nr:MAG: hypothetical protein GOMPHAMPRED_008156 [Gomphillus americanus]